MYSYLLFNMVNLLVNVKYTWEFLSIKITLRSFFIHKVCCILSNSPCRLWTSYLIFIIIFLESDLNIIISTIYCFTCCVSYMSQAELCYWIMCVRWHIMHPSHCVFRQELRVFCCCLFQQLQNILCVWLVVCKVLYLRTIKFLKVSLLDSETSHIFYNEWTSTPSIYTVPMAASCFVF